MFLINNVVIGIIIGIIFFFVFTFINVYTFSQKNRLTSVVLTLNFLYLFFVGPFKVVNAVSKNKKTFINKVKFDKELNKEQKEELISIFNSKYKTFKLMYRMKQFDYNNLMLKFARWYLDKPFEIKIRVRLKQSSLENAYISEMKSELIPTHC